MITQLPKMPDAIKNPLPDPIKNPLKDPLARG
mgnify:FL=1